MDEPDLPETAAARGDAILADVARMVPVHRERHVVDQAHRSRLRGIDRRGRHPSWTARGAADSQCEWPADRRPTLALLKVELTKWLRCPDSSPLRDGRDLARVLLSLAGRAFGSLVGGVLVWRELSGGGTAFWR